MNYKPQPNFITLPLFGKKPLPGDPVTITDENAYHFAYDIAKATVRISSGEWTNDECLVMQKCLKDNFNLETSFYMLSSTSDQPAHFYVKKESYPQFYEHVKPTVDRLIQDHPKVLTSVGVEKKVRLEQP